MFIMIIKATSHNRVMYAFFDFVKSILWNINLPSDYLNIPRVNMDGIIYNVVYREI